MRITDSPQVVDSKIFQLLATKDLSSSVSSYIVTALEWNEIDDVA